MKKRISATVDEKTEKTIKALLRDNIYRNKSHLIEKAIESLKKEIDKNDKS